MEPAFAAPSGVLASNGIGFPSSRSTVSTRSFQARHAQRVRPLHLVGVNVTEEEAVARLSLAFPYLDKQVIIDTLNKNQGDDDLTLYQLTKTSPQMEKKEKEIEEFRKKGRISAMEEAALRRRVVGSAKDFFKGYVEVKGQYIDSGWVDESAERKENPLVGKVMGVFGGLFGKNEAKVMSEQPQKKEKFVPRISEYIVREVPAKDVASQQ